MSVAYDFGTASKFPLLDDLYRDHPLLPNFPGVGLVLPSQLSYDATARVSW